MKSPQTMDELRIFLASQLEKISNGEITPAAANAAANTSGKIMQGVKISLEYCKMTGQKPYIPFINIDNKKEQKKLDNY